MEKQMIAYINKETELDWEQPESSCLDLQLAPPHKGFKRQMCFPTLGNWIIATTRTSVFWPS